MKFNKVINFMELSTLLNYQHDKSVDKNRPKKLEPMRKEIDEFFEKLIEKYKK